MNTAAADSDQQASVATFLQILQHLGWTYAREIDDAKCRDLGHELNTWGSGNCRLELEMRRDAIAESRLGN